MSVTARQREHYSHMYIVAVLRGRLLYVV